MTGLELSILLDPNERSPAVLQTLNIGRENYKDSLPFPLIIWLPEYAYVKLANTAPDFWSVRDGSYTFFTDKKQQVTMPEELKAGKDLTIWQDKLAQIPLLERFLEWPNKPDPEIRIDLLLKLGDAYDFIRKLERAKQSYEDALQLNAKTVKDIEREGIARNKLGLIFSRLNNPVLALQYLNRYLEIGKRHSKLESQAVAHNHLGLVYDRCGQYDQALRHYRLALELNRTIGKRRMEGDVLGNIGLLYRKWKRFDEAIRYHEKALGISREVHDSTSVALDLGNIGLVYHDTKDYKSAIRYFSEALEISCNMGNKGEELRQLLNIGDAWKDGEEFESALNYYNKALKLAEEMNYGVFSTLRKFVDLYRTEAIRDFQKERAYLRRLIQRARQIHDLEREWFYLESLISLCEQQGELLKKNECALELENVLQRLVLQSKPSVKYYEKLIRAYQILGKQKEVVEYTGKLEELRSRYLTIWIARGDG